jgi:hypothetical protein
MLPDPSPTSTAYIAPVVIPPLSEIHYGFLMCIRNVFDEDLEITFQCHVADALKRYLRMKH